MDYLMLAMSMIVGGAGLASLRGAEPFLKKFLLALGGRAPWFTWFTRNRHSFKMAET
jgi:hypothetical protein